MVQEIRQELNKINDLLRGVTPYRLGVADPSEFVPADVNAHFMPKNQFDQLVRNIKADGNLSSLPFCWMDKEGKIHTMSGHHRIEAAAAAGVKSVIFLYTDADLTEDERTAIQLSHNAIFGEDDLGILKRQWESISSIEAKLYSGLDDNYFKTFDPVDLGAFNEKDLTFERIELLFLPEQVVALTEALQRLQKKGRVSFAGEAKQYDNFTEVLMTLKDRTNIYNTAIAFEVMIQVSELYCDFLESREKMDEADWHKLHEEMIKSGMVNAT